MGSAAVTVKLGHEPIAMRRVESASSAERLGDFYWKSTEYGRVITIAIPAGRMEKWVFSRWTIGHKNAYGAQWTWDGDENKPTLRPSLHAVDVWHGHVKKGMLVEA